MQNYFLRSNALGEPLVNRWYAWLMLLSPATTGLVTKNLHSKIMRSYLKNPETHKIVSKDSLMRGAPFIDFGEKQKVCEVENLLDSIESRWGYIIGFAEALEELNELMEETCDGHSLIPLYDELPEILKGYVELVYDTNSNPGFRVLEGLLYESDFYDDSAQEFSLSLVYRDDRPFVLSTPRVQESHKLMWKVPFSSPEVDTLFRAREYPISQQELEDFFARHFEDTNHNRELFWSLFEPAEQGQSPRVQLYKGDGVRIRYLGHACVLIETSGCSVLIDPIVSYGGVEGMDRYSFEDLPEKIDYVLLTHSHQDHVLLETLLQLRYKIRNIVVPKNISGSLQDPSLKLMLRKLNFENVIELDEMESFEISGGKITGLPFFGEHGDLHITSKTSFAVELLGRNMLFAADSNNLSPELYTHLSKLFPKFDVAFIGMECDGAPMSWLYGPVIGRPISRSMDQSRRLDGSDCDKAFDIISKFDCDHAYIYAMGKEPWLSYITSIEYTKKSKPLIESDKLVERCLSNSVISERLFGQKEIKLSTLNNSEVAYA